MLAGSTCARTLAPQPAGLCTAAGQAARSAPLRIGGSAVPKRSVAAQAKLGWAVLHLAPARFDKNYANVEEAKTAFESALPKDAPAAPVKLDAALAADEVIAMAKAALAEDLKAREAERAKESQAAKEAKWKRLEAAAEQNAEVAATTTTQSRAEEQTEAAVEDTCARAVDARRGDAPPQEQTYETRTVDYGKTRHGTMHMHTHDHLHRH